MRVGLFFSPWPYNLATAPHRGRASFVPLAGRRGACVLARAVSSGARPQTVFPAANAKGEENEPFPVINGRLCV